MNDECQGHARQRRGQQVQLQVLKWGRPVMLWSHETFIMPGAWDSYAVLNLVGNHSTVPVFIHQLEK